MQHIHFYLPVKPQHWIGARSPRRPSKGIRAAILACAAGFIPALAQVVVAAPFVEFDIAPTAECRDITPLQRIAQYPNQRLIEVALPISVRFRGVDLNDVDELDIEVNGSWARMRVHDFAPTTQLASDISHEIETTTTTKKDRSLDGSLGGTIPIPGAEAAAHLTPSITAALSNCETATEKINRLPPKYAVVVSGTSSSGRGVFFKLKRSSQTSLEGLHELAVTFVAPRIWQRSEILVNCTARGQRKTMLWMKQSGTIGEASHTVQLVEMSAKPIHQTVLKPAEGDPATAKLEPKTDKTAAATTPTVPTATQWRAAVRETVSAEVSAQLSDAAVAKAKKPGAKPGAASTD